MSTGAEETSICYDCIGDSFLKEDVQTTGEVESCNYCGETRESIALDELSARIHRILQEYFSLTASDPGGFEYALSKEGDWERSGEQVEYVIAEIAGLEEEIAGNIREHLSDQYGYSAVRDGEEDPYAREACYEEKAPDDWNFQESWSTFCSEIRSHARFFSRYAREALDEIFYEVASLRTWEDKSAIREIKPADKDRYLFRARVALSRNELQSILKDPARGLGPPPSRKAKAGRMNASGIPVFYGAVDEETCIAEARGPVGSRVALGRFEVIRPLRLLDFDVLTEVYVEGSMFDPDYHTRCERVTFLRRLVREISRPVMPRDKEFEYLPTQAVAEYLAGCTDPPIDGIIFHSTQTTGKGRNVVLFNHACGIEKYDVPKDTEFDFLMDWETEDDFDDGIAVFERVPPEPSKEVSSELELSLAKIARMEYPANWEEESLDEAPGQHNPTLRLDVESVCVLNVQGVRYNYHKRRVTRYRHSKDEDYPF